MNVSIPGQSKALFRDEFVVGHTGTWTLESDDIGSSAIVPEQLVIELNSPNLIQYSMLKEPVFSDFALEVDGRLTGGSSTTTYGVMFRMQSPDEFYRFEITGDGLYVLERHDADGSWVRFSEDWLDAAVINQGVGAANKLKVVADGANISVYVNDALLEQVTDNAYTSGNIALDIGTFDGVGARVSFDNLVVYPPDG
ncbi:MAG: family 16 glycoside hydrolase [Candidatus Promineifilaceae bacterium]|nr:family 16 glycoside hydrolase [Candidatus Promineifilaceae bacterium]